MSAHPLISRGERGMSGMTQPPDGQGAGSTSTSATAQRATA